MPLKTKKTRDRTATRLSHFAEVLKANVPHGRRGKHKDVVSDILADLTGLTEGSAIRIPLADLGTSKEKMRSALSRACQQRAIKVVTSSDADYLYVWPAAKPLMIKRKLIG